MPSSFHIVLLIVVPVTCVVLHLLLNPPIPPNVTDHQTFSAPLTPAQYDYIVVGGGTAGNIVASLLSDSPSMSILLLESGPYTKYSLLSLPSIPGLTSLNVASGALDHKLKLSPQTAALKTSASPGFVSKRERAKRVVFFGGWRVGGGGAEEVRVKDALFRTN